MTPPERDDRTVVLYDRDCGFCRWSLARVLELDRRRALRPVALQDPEADRLLWPMPRERRFASAHLVTPDGTVHSGGTAVAPLVRMLPAGAPLAPIARLLSRPLDAAYRAVANSRGLLGRLVPTAAKNRATGEIDRHAATPARS
jgi:predicted DCC family thiol-disulfide oxidoreductase YuxK